MSSSSTTHKDSTYYSRIGRLGGLSTLAKYGPEFFSMIGKLGQRAYQEKYELVPCGLSDFAIRNRKTGQVVNTLKGKG